MEGVVEADVTDAFPEEKVVEAGAGGGAVGVALVTGGERREFAEGVGIVGELSSTETGSLAVPVAAPFPSSF